MLFNYLENKIRGFLSHYPKWYAFISGAGIIIFWRGVWHSVDYIHVYFHQYAIASNIDMTTSPWWDGPLSLIFGMLVLLLTGTFESSFIGNEIILAGLRGEKQLSKKTEVEVRTEVGAIADIKEQLMSVSRQLEDLDLRVQKDHARHSMKNESVD